MDESQPTTTESPKRAFAFASLAYSAGLLGFLAWGWVAATIFLLMGGGLQSPAEEPVLSFMLPWGTPLFVLGSLASLFAWTLNAPRLREAPWRWMLRVQLSSVAPCIVGWLAWALTD